MEILAEASQSHFESVELPNEPIKLTYLASFLLNIPTSQKQRLLDIEAADELIQTSGRYTDVVTLLNTFLTPGQRVDNGPFSPN